MASRIDAHIITASRPLCTMALGISNLPVSLPGSSPSKTGVNAFMSGQSSIHGRCLLDRPVKPGDDSRMFAGVTAGAAAARWTSMLRGDIRRDRIADDRTRPHDSFRNACRCRRHRTAPRAYVRTRTLCAHGVSDSRGRRAPGRSLVHGADRYLAGWLREADADSHRRDQGADARPADGRTAVPQAGERAWPDA